MRIDRIAPANFLSHTATDWNPGEARLVALIGPNGAGKSSLAVDSLRYVLFDDARGRTDELVQLGTTDMSVVVEFVHAGGRYRVTRGRTTRSGGRTFLELHVAQADGAWRPLTGATIRDTQQLIEELLRVDAATFETAVVLAQGDAMRFAQATAAERKRILGKVLELDLWERAERGARDASIEISGRERAADARLIAIAEQLTRRPRHEEALGLATSDAGAWGSRILEATTERGQLEARLRELTKGLAAGDAAKAEAGRIAQQLVELRDRYRAAAARRQGAIDRGDRARRVLELASVVEEAQGRVGALEADVQRLERAEAEGHELDEKIRVAREDHQRGTAAADREHATWKATYEATRRQVDELAVAVTALPPVECPHCHRSFVTDQADLQGRLSVVRRLFRELEASEPKASTSAARDAAAIARLESRRREIGDARGALTSARMVLSDIQRAAARAGEMARARKDLAAAEGDVQAAAAELEEINAGGQRARERLAELQPAIDARATLTADQDRVLRRHEQLQRELLEYSRNRDEAIAAVAREQAAIDELDRLTSEQGDVRREVERLAREASLLRRLIAAFGVGGIPARIIEGVLPELTSNAQELLGELRPGMTIAIRAQRVKKDGKGIVEALDLVVQDDAGERPLAMFSGGERMSVSLALAVGLSRLVARRAGTALRTLVIDEPDGLDADARRAFGQALRLLAHHGELERVLLVSHHEDLAEFADAIYRVSKNGHGSVVELVA